MLNNESERASLVAQMIKYLPAMQETQVRSLGREDPLEKEMATHSTILAWKIPWTEEPGGLQSMGLQRVGHDWATNTSTLYSCLKWLILYYMNCTSIKKKFKWLHLWLKCLECWWVYSLWWGNSREKWAMRSGILFRQGFLNLICLADIQTDIQAWSAGKRWGGDINLEIIGTWEEF